MLKETETEEPIGFFVTFLSLLAFQLRGAPPPPPWLPTRVFASHRDKRPIIIVCLTDKVQP